MFAVAPSAISAFESTFKSLVSGATGIIPESTISPVPELVHTDSLSIEPDSELLASTVVLKLNGGPETGMGLDKAKSLLKVKNDETFLDLTAKQVMCMRKEFGQNVKFMLMNSFSTSDDTLEFFRTKYPNLAAEEGLEMMQNKVPKIDAKTFEVRLRGPWAAGIDRANSSFLRRSLQHARLIPATSGAHLVMATSTQPLLARGVLQRS